MKNIGDKMMNVMMKISQFKIVRAVMAAGMATIPFTIVGSMVLVLNVIPQVFSATGRCFECFIYEVQ